jgi:FtsH-binding integral membrane protein
VDPTVYGLVIGAIAVAGVFWLNRSHRWSPIELSIFFAFAVSGALGLGLFVALSSPDQFKAPSKAR